MTSAAKDPVSDLRSTVLEAVSTLRGSSEGGSPNLERPKRADQGDYATNAAMLLAPSLGAPPRDIAERLGGALSTELDGTLASFAVAGPGFLNLTLSDGWFRDAVRLVLDAGEQFGGGGTAKPERINLEFVSANPTGPTVVANGRAAAYGDTLANILTHHGHSVSREYYFNDAGSQIDRLGESVRARALGEAVPEDGYQGEYIKELADQIEGADDPSVDTRVIAARAVEILLAMVKATLARYGVEYDTFFSESTLHQGDPSELDRAIAIVREQGHVYEHDHATWLRTTSFGDDKDRVLLRSDGEPTYFAADIAYMDDKLERGFERLLMPLGADHHGYVGRLKAGFQALGNDPELMEPVIMQLVHLVDNDGHRARMSKRRGDFITLDDLLDEIGVDATRYFMLQSSHDRTLNLNLDLAKSESSENPVYYIQYAHARIATMLARVADERVAAALDRDAVWAADVELHPSERELVKKLLELPAEIRDAADKRAPHRIAGYALELAQDFTAFYRDCKVVGATPEELESFRIALSVATQQTLALVLGLLGVSAPDSM